MPKLIDRTGIRYGKLVVLERAISPAKVYWLCQCDCGRQTRVDSGSLQSGNTKSCGHHCSSVMLTHKVCSKCKIDKPASEYTRTNRKRSGIVSRCKPCNSKDVVNRTKAMWHKNRKKILARNKAWLLANPEKRKRHLSNYNNTHSKHVQIRAITNDAIARGALARGACAACGAMPVDAHHVDYNKPLEVTWLCKPHHGAWHRLFLAEDPK